MDRICPFYSKIGTCRHGTSCSKKHDVPTRSRVVLLQGFCREPESGVMALAEDVLIEATKLGRPVGILISSNLNEHLKGNVYLEMYSSYDAEAVVADFGSRWYDTHPVKASLCPALDISSPRCRDKQLCTRGKQCNYVHPYMLDRTKLDEILDEASR